MNYSDIPPSEQEVIDDFGVKLKRIDLDNEKSLEILREFEKNPNSSWKYHVGSALRMDSNSYNVYKGHIITLKYIHYIGTPELRKLPENLGNLKELLFLDIVHSRIKKIPESIDQLKKLLHLLIYYNFDLFSLPESLGELSNLIGLVLRDNNLIALPESIGRKFKQFN